MCSAPGPLKLGNIDKVWIMGAGYFGLRALAAVEAVLTVGRDQVTVVDRDSRRLAGLRNATACADGPAWLNAHLPDEASPEGEGGHWGEGHLIIPALPIHLAADWLKARFAGSRAWHPLPVPEAVLATLPNPSPFPHGGGLYTSIATWRCPEDCPAPASHCTHTGQPREPDLYTAVDGLHLPDARTILLHSRQLAPGVGGYTARQLREACRAARRASRNLLVATVCRCHGVLDYFGPGS